MKKASVERALWLPLLFVVAACGAEAESSPWRAPSGDRASAPADSGASPAHRVDAAARPDLVSCPSLAGTWKGTIEGKANTYLQNVDITGVATMTVAAGPAPGEFKLTSLDVEAWSPLLPMFKVPLKTIGEHAFHCDTFNIATPIEAQGKKGSGTITGQCTGAQCTGTFKGTTDDDTMDAQGTFKITK